MSGDHSQDPLARYLDEMLDDENTAGPTWIESAQGTGSEFPTQVVASALPEADWWGFGVAHLILVLRGDAVAAIRDQCDGDWLSDDGALLQGWVELDNEGHLLVDAARMILPEEHFKALPPLSQRAGGVIQVKDTGVALLTDSEPMPIEISEDEIRWRKGAGSRRWMAGTIMNRSMVVLDVAGLLETASMGE
ncbi:hypothetical protein J2T60_000425 [Natronospira proteinivora]|uniref:Chemotaxis protein CheW n=1 Tax=Natronospira proteinivora TaxID=1807133 RepID=A0ABT1G691_9GAMM|nr:hypothetical protein [Natronospira proteinivora]MCP1726460.1 hypothetical protein [Natronospira proteinivora]